MLFLIVPVVQGGMQWVGYAELASAVSNAGGLGIVGFRSSRAVFVCLHALASPIPSPIPVSHASLVGVQTLWGRIR